MTCQVAQSCAEILILHKSPGSLLQFFIPGRMGCQPAFTVASAMLTSILFQERLSRDCRCAWAPERLPLRGRCNTFWNRSHFCVAGTSCTEVFLRGRRSTLILRSLPVRALGPPAGPSRPASSFFEASHLASFEEKSFYDNLHGPEASKPVLSVKMCNELQPVLQRRALRSR